MDREPAPFVDIPIEQFEIYRAEFKPRRADDLVPGADAWIGRYGEWQAAWVIEDGQFRGEWAMTWLCAVTAKSDEPPFAWVPSGDLVFFDSEGVYGSHFIRPLPISSSA